MVGSKVLIVDDEERMRRLVGDFLKKQGYAVIEAADGREALDLFMAHQDFDLIILDVMMPEYDGWAVCREIRKSSQVPIIMLTAREKNLMNFSALTLVQMNTSPSRSVSKYWLPGYRHC